MTFYDYADIRHEAEIVEWAISQLTGALDGEATFTASNFTVQALKRMYPSEIVNINLIYSRQCLCRWFRASCIILILSKSMTLLFIDCLNLFSKSDISLAIGAWMSFILSVMIRAQY